MRIPVIRGRIDRRILVNFRVDPAALADLLPAPFRPQVVNGFGVAGICLIRLRQVRPRFLPRGLGIASENAAHRIAVRWQEGGQTRTGVFIPRRDTSSRLNAFAGGRLFPGIHHWARFDVRESADEFHVAMCPPDGSVRLQVAARRAVEMPEDSIFSSVDEASQFFEAGSLGYSPQRANGFDGLELRCFNWRVEPLLVTRVASSFFADRQRFPAGAATFDHALLMQGIEHEWHGRESLCCRGDEAAARSS